jgi:hypothetical protein
MKKAISYLIYLGFMVLLPVQNVFAASDSIDIGVSIPGTVCTQGTLVALPQYISCWYQFGTFLVFGLGILFIAFGGYKYIASQGNPDSLKEAKDIIFAGIAGIVIMALGYLILTTISPGIVEPG